MSESESFLHPPDGQTMSLKVAKEIQELYQRTQSLTFLGIHWAGTDRNPKPELVTKSTIELIKVPIETEADGITTIGNAGAGKSTILSLFAEAADKVSGEKFAWWFVLWDLVLARQIKATGKKTDEFTQEEWDATTDIAYHEDYRGTDRLLLRTNKIRKGREFPLVGLVPNLQNISKRRGWDYVEGVTTQDPRHKLTIAVSSSLAVMEEARNKRKLAVAIKQVTPENLVNILQNLKERGLDIEQDLEVLESEGYERLDLLQRLSQMLGNAATVQFIDMLWKELLIDAYTTQMLLERRNSPLRSLKKPIANHLRKYHAADYDPLTKQQKEDWTVVILHWLKILSGMGQDHRTGVVAVNSFSEKLANPGMTLKVMKGAYGKAKTYTRPD